MKKIKEFMAQPFTKGDYANCCVLGIGVSIGIWAYTLYTLNQWGKEDKEKESKQDENVIEFSL